MPSVTYDGQSLMLDGRRIWLTSGTICYARVARAHWADRIHAAKLAGLNAIEVPVVWSRHEPRPGHFEFSGENDLRHFIKLIGLAGLHCLLKPGPYVGSDFDFGGLPPWIGDLPNIKLRTANGPFLEACSRYFGALAEQVKDLQVTSTGAGGPIMLIQSESHWTCGHEELAHSYLGELSRYMREAGIAVPIITANHLWQSVEGQIDCWSGSGDLLSAMRQFSAVRPLQPRIVIDFEIGASAAWGEKESSGHALSPWVLTRQLAEVLAGGAQFNIQPFFGGSNFGFSGGRSAAGHGRFVTESFDRSAPLSEAGTPRASYQALKRIATFSNRFARVFANLENQNPPVVLDPSHARRGKEGSSAAVVPISGSQGGAAFVFSGREEGDDTPTTAELLMPDGATLEVDLTGQPVVWCLLDVHVGGRAQLDYCSLSALASNGKAFVCFGRAGTKGQISINGSPIEVTVPTGKLPEIVELEGIAVVVCSFEQTDATYVHDSAVYVGVAGVAADGRPMLPHGASPKSITRIDLEGVVTGGATGLPLAGPPPVKAPHEDSVPRATFAPWAAATTTDYLDGSNPRFATIAGPAELGKLGSPYGYGWYRVNLKGTGAGKIETSFAQAGDRLHVFQEGKFVALLGVGPGADADLNVSVKKGAGPIVVLAENAGRFSAGPWLGEKKGIFGHLWETTTIRAGKPKLVKGDPIDLLGFRTPLWEVRQGDSTLPDRVTWALQHRSKTPLIVRFSGEDRFPARALLVVNNKPLAFLDASTPPTLVIEEESLARGNNTIQIAMTDGAQPLDAADPESLLRLLANRVSFADAHTPISAKAEWAFAKWELPPASAYGQPGKAPPGGKAHGPLWWKSTFKAAETLLPLSLDLSGLTKGQVYVNGKHVGRYFVASADHKAVGPQTRMLLPTPWLNAGAENTVVIFDEHGAAPAKVRLSYSHELPVIAQPT